MAYPCRFLCGTLIGPSRPSAPTPSPILPVGPDAPSGFAEALAKTEIRLNAHHAGTGRTSRFGPNLPSKGNGSKNKTSNQFSGFDNRFLNITPPTSAGWTTYLVPLTASAGWYSPTGGTDFALAMGGGSTQQMGIRLQYQAGSSQTQRYGIADYQVLGNQEVNITAVPEPDSASYMLCGALLIRGVLRREKRRGSHLGS